MNGSVQKLPDRPKPWRARYRGPDGVEHSKTYRRHVDAERWLRDELGKTDRGAWIDPSAGEVDFAEGSEGWLRGLILKPKTRAGYESLLRSRVLPRFGPMPIARITPGEVRAWLTDMTDEGLSAARVRQARQVLHASLEVAVADGLLARNPTEQVKPPTVHRRRQLFLTAGELATLSEACEDRQPNMGAFVLLLGWSGLRWGEAVALRGKSVNRRSRRIRVAEAVAEVGGRLEWGTPKTHEARVVIVPGFITEALPIVAPDELVFTAPKGGPLRTSNFRRDVWAPACGASRMPAGLLVHDLRDTAASLAISAGASIKAVQRMLGHASAAMTLDTYGSLFEDDLEDLADRLEAKFDAGRSTRARVVSLTG
ncbi:MAG: site-specific integrase [Acidobacteria bacterium]|nr:site-specific integrase [Acidobacteriota bacterium]